MQEVSMLSSGGLFDDATRAERLAEGIVLLHGFVADPAALLLCVQQVLLQAPLRHMQTPGGLRMAVAMSNCGDLGWISDQAGYRYSRVDPLSKQPWPALPGLLRQLGEAAAAAAGYAGFVADACLINRYEPGTRLSLHQDRNERDLNAPIVSGSLGLPAVFLFGGLRRAERSARLPLQHGDVLVWGGPDRLRFHGVMPIAPGVHPVTGGCRINLTLRRAG